MDFLQIFFFFILPTFFGFLQFFVTRSKNLSLGKKYIPLAAVSLTAALTWGACTGFVPLPQTYFLDEGSFLAFPDYFFVALCCFPAYFGLMIGALFGVSSPWENFRKK